MPNWSGTVLTTKGLALHAKAEAGAPMTITKLKIGDGVLASGQSVSSLNDLVSPKKIIDVSALTPLEGGICKIHGVVANVGIETGFYVRELGVFAQDPDLGEILYAYTADGSPDYLPAEGGPVAVSEELVVNLAFSNAATITAHIALDGLVTVNIMNNAVNAHNTDTDAHGNRYLKIAGGTMEGPLILASDPIAPLQAATKKYTDDNGGVNMWRPNRDYVLGDICYSKNAASYKRMECVVPGKSGNAEPAWTGIGTLVTDGTITWIVDDARDGARPGDVITTYAPTPRPGTMIADGSAVSRAMYSRLFAAIGTTYGAGDGSTTFNLPDHRDRMTLAKGTAFPTIGAKGGEASHVLTESEGPIHGHAINDPGHGHTFEIWHSSPGDNGHISTTYTLNYYGTFTTPASKTGITLQNSNGGAAHNNMPPYLTALACIKY